jgi:hypothetical protein
MKLFFLILGFLILLFVEIGRVYFIMPFPGSQKNETIDLAYFIHNNINYFRLLGFVLFLYPAIYFFRHGSQVVKITLAVVFGFYGVVFYMFNFRMMADKMFLQPESKVLLNVQDNKVKPSQLVVGVTINNESKAYPIEIIGYHHQVRDSLGGKPIMVTYCTVCRTGRVFSPIVEGHNEVFRLVGMDHFNAMFEDAQTKSWWRQASGEAIVGPMKGKRLDEISASQMTLAEWINLHPDTKVLQPDPKFKKAYDGLKNYDEGKMDSSKLVRKDSTSWKDKSWVVAIQRGLASRAYDWIELQKIKLVNDTIQDLSVLVAALPDSASFYTMSRVVDADTLKFTLASDSTMTDTQTHSTWTLTGKCTDGAMLGKQLLPIPSYQEYWHSWRTFHPRTSRYVPKKVSE